MKKQLTIKKSIALVSILTMFALSMSGCGSKPAAAPAADPAPTESTSAVEPEAESSKADAPVSSDFYN